MMKKCLITALMTLLALVVITGNVYAAVASISASNSEIKLGDTVNVIVSFGQNVSAAQFNLSYDNNQLEYVSYSCGGSGIKEYSSSAKKFGYAATKADISSVSFKFKTKTLGDAKVSIHNLEISTDTQTQVPASIGRSEISIKVKKASTSQTTNQTNNNSNKNKNEKPSNDNQPDDNQVEEPTTPVDLAPDALISLSRKGVTTFKDNISDVMIKALPIALDIQTVLEVNIITEDDEEYDKISTILRKVEGNKKCYSINLLKDGEIIEPNGYVTVCIPIPAEYNKERVDVYSINEEDESYKLVSGKIQEDYYTFTANHLSTYALVEDPEPTVTTNTSTDKTDEKVLEIMHNLVWFFTNLNVLYAIIGILIVIIIIILIVKSRKSKRN